MPAEDKITGDDLTARLENVTTIAMLSGGRDGGFITEVGKQAAANSVDQSAKAAPVAVPDPLKTAMNFLTPRQGQGV